MFFEHTVELIQQRGVSMEAIAKIVFDLQKPYNDRLTLQDCLESVEAVLRKREVQNAMITGIALDRLAEKEQLPFPLQEMLETDEPLFGIDEILALSITNIYGSIGLTTFGYLDKMKCGVIGRLDRNGDEIHVFFDDLIAGVTAAASARIAHRKPDWDQYQADQGG